MIQLTVNAQPRLDAIQCARNDLIRLGILPHPDYGADDLHNARLLGAYHARKGWGDNEAVYAWVLSLSPTDARFLHAYIGKGKPGRTELDGSHSPNIALVGLGAAVHRDMGVDLSQAIEAARMMGAAFDEAAVSLIESLAPAFEEFVITVERINLRHNLQRAFVPAPVACWLARRWPAWALPAVAWVRLRKRWETFRHDA